MTKDVPVVPDCRGQATVALGRRYRRFEPDADNATVKPAFAQLVQQDVILLGDFD
jgi:hypothetical protein